jgi:hypothetical protein
LLPGGELPVLGGGDHGTAIVSTLRATFEVARDRPDAAAVALARAYPAAVASQDMPILSLVAVGVAELAGARREYRESATLLGAAARLRGAEDPTDFRVAELTRAGREALGEAGFAEAYAAGWSLDTRTALARVDPGRREALPAVEQGQVRRA